MSTLDVYAAFLTARWDEIEEAAKAVDPESWSYDVTRNHEVWAEGDRVSVGVGFLLEDLATKRGILALHPEILGICQGCACEQYPCRTVVALTYPFRDHPDHPANQEAT